MKKTLLSALMFVACTAMAFAETVTFDWSGVTTTQTGLTSDNVYNDGVVTLTFEKAGGSNVPAENKDGEIRMYKNTSLTIAVADGYVITNVDFTPTSSTYSAEKLTYDGVAISDAWTLETPTYSVLLSATANARFKQIVVTYEALSSTAPARPEVKALGTVYADQYFSEPMSVEITAEAGDIYYTTGEEEFSVETWTKYEAPFEIDQTTTVRTVAYNGTESSSEVSRTYSCIDVIDGIADLRAEFNAGDVALVNLRGAIVTGVYDRYTYVEDANAGITLYGVSAGLQAGMAIEGVVAVKLGVYNNLKQITSILDSEQATITTTGMSVVPTIITIADYLNNPEAYESRYIKLENVVAQVGVEDAKNDTLIQGEDKIVLYGNTTTFTTLQGRAYNVTGWGGVYKNTRQISLNDVANLELLAGELAEAESAWSEDTLVIASGEAWEVANAFTTKSDAEVVYASSNEAVATVDAEGKVTVVGYGYAEISAATAETESYHASEEKFAIYVLEGNGTFESPYTVFDALYFYEKGTTEEAVWVKAPIIGCYANNALVEGVTNAQPSNIAIGTAESHLIVQLSSGTVARKNCNLVDNPELLGKEVWLYGKLQMYFNVAGLKSVTDYSLDGITTSIETVEVAGNGEAAVYDLSGRRVVNPEKGVYIIGGKKVLVK